MSDPRKPRNSAPVLRPEESARRKSADSGRRPAVFLDRDGTLIEEVGYVNHLDRVRVYPWAAEAVHKLNQAGLLVVVLTNQSGVARGYFTEELVEQVHQKIARELAARNARVDAFYYCPHHPNAPIERYRRDCRCRKPSTGLLEESARRFAIDLQSSFVVGDSYRDMQLGFNAGARTILVMSGYGRGEYEHQRANWLRNPDGIAENLLEAVDRILEELAQRAAEPAPGARAPRSL